MINDRRIVEMSEDLGRIFTTFLERFESRIERDGTPVMTPNEYDKITKIVKALNDVNSRIDEFHTAAVNDEDLEEGDIEIILEDELE